MAEPTPHELQQAKIAQPIPVVDLAALLRIARRAGSEIMSWYTDDRLVAATKADASPVTQADLAAHAVLAEALPSLLPGVPVVSEETSADGVATLALMRASPCYWLIDPLDGTKDFLAHSGDFTVNIALMVDQQPVLGCVLAPETGIGYIGGVGRGANVQAAADAPLLPVAGRPADPLRFTCLVSRKHQMGEADFVREVFPEVEIRTVGSALKYAQIAAGLADISVRRTPTSLWDTAASQALLTAAGGMLIDFNGVALRYDTGSLVNPSFIAVGRQDFPWRDVLAKLTAAFHRPRT